jgi:hypothetical protein
MKTNPDNIHRTDVVSTEFIRAAYNLCRRAKPVDPILGNMTIAEVMRRCGCPVHDSFAALEVADFAYQVSNFDGDNSKFLMGTVVYRACLRLAAHAAVCGVQFAAQTWADKEDLIRQSSQVDSCAWWGELYARMCKQLNTVRMGESLSAITPFYVLPLSRSTDIKDGEVTYAATLYPGVFPGICDCPSVFDRAWEWPEGKIHPMGERKVYSAWFAEGYASVEVC